MARKILTITIQDAGRDKGKVFVITEMSAVKAEKWAARAIIAMMKGGVEIPDDIGRLGFAGLAILGIRSLGGLAWEAAEPLLDEMWDCVTHIPDPTKPNVIRGLIDDDIEEVTTRIHLRKEIFKLHIDFFTAAAPLGSSGAAAAVSA